MAEGGGVEGPMEDAMWRASDREVICRCCCWCVELMYERMVVGMKLVRYRSNQRTAVVIGRCVPS